MYVHNIQYIAIICIFSIEAVGWWWCNSVFVSIHQASPSLGWEGWWGPVCHRSRPAWAPLMACLGSVQLWTARKVPACSEWKANPPVIPVEAVRLRPVIHFLLEVQESTLWIFLQVSVDCMRQAAFTQTYDLRVKTQHFWFIWRGGGEWADAERGYSSAESWTWFIVCITICRRLARYQDGQSHVFLQSLVLF